MFCCCCSLHFVDSDECFSYFHILSWRHGWYIFAIISMETDTFKTHNSNVCSKSVSVSVQHTSCSHVHAYGIDWHKTSSNTKVWLKSFSFLLGTNATDGVSCYFLISGVSLIRLYSNCYHSVPFWRCPFVFLSQPVSIFLLVVFHTCSIAFLYRSCAIQCIFCTFQTKTLTMRM